MILKEYTIILTAKGRLSRCPRKNAGAFSFGESFSLEEISFERVSGGSVSVVKYAPTIPPCGMVPGAGLVLVFRMGKGEEKKAKSCGKKWPIFQF